MAYREDACAAVIQGLEAIGIDFFIHVPDSFGAPVISHFEQDPSVHSFPVAREEEGIGIASGLAFSPDDTRLAVTLNTPKTPSDTYVITLGKRPLDYGKLVRWTYSEVGGLDTSTFPTPQLVEFPTFDEVNGAPRQIPAWVYKPPGKGPFPVVVSIHGGPESQARPFFSSTYQMWLKTLGVAIVVPHVRGCAGYGKSYLAVDNGLKRVE